VGFGLRGETQPGFCSEHRRAVIPAPEAIFREVPVSRERSQNISDELLQNRPAILRSITRAGSDRNVKNSDALSLEEKRKS